MAPFLSLLALVLTFAMVSCAPRVRVSHSIFEGPKNVTDVDVRNRPKLRYKDCVDLEASDTKMPCHAYYGIPFAEPPIYKLRFRPPVPFSNRRPRIFNATTYKPACVQRPSLLNIIDTNEDCLYLNVFTPDVGEATRHDVYALKKVLVCIHGGAFRQGATSMNSPLNIVTGGDIIVVTITYRLGLLGFLSSGDEALPGNHGLLDQITALRWVKDNIRKFGGDPSDVTLYGTSAGSVSASHLSLSPLAKGLFSKVILESGVALAPWAIDKRSEDHFHSLAEKANCLPTGRDAKATPQMYHSQIVDCLRHVNPHRLESLLENDTLTTPEDALSMEGYEYFGPVVDGAVITRDPNELMKDVAYLKAVGALDRKYMVGVSNNEAVTFIIGNTNLSLSLEHFLNPDDPLAWSMIKNNFRSVHLCPVTEEILHMVSFLYYYPRDINGSSSFQVYQADFSCGHNFLSFTNFGRSYRTSADFMSDIDFIVPAIKFVRLLTETSSDAMAYLSVFDYNPPLEDPQFPFRGSMHAFASIVGFDNPFALLRMFPFFSFPAETLKSLSKTFRGMVTNFVKNGDPSIPDSPRWPPYDRDNEHYMSISENPKVQQHPFARRVALWEDLLPKVLGSVFTRGTGKAPITPR